MDLEQRLNRLGRRMDDMILGMMTSNMTPPEPSNPLSFDKLNRMIADLGSPPPPRLGQIVESVHMVDCHEDWSKVRSPSRTLRRMRHNASRIYTYAPKKEALQMPDGSLVMHPVMARELRRKLEAKD